MPTARLCSVTPATGLRKVAATGPVAYVTTVPPGENSHRRPWFLSDGRRFLYFARGEAQKRGIYVGALDGAAPVQLMESAFSAIYANGYLLTVHDGTLLAYPFDPGTLVLIDQPLTIASTVAGSSTQQAPFSVSTNGVMSWGGALQDQTELTWFDRRGQVLATPVQVGSFVNFRFSPN